MVVPVKRKRNLQEPPTYEDHPSSEGSDFDQTGESDYESEEEQPKKRSAPRKAQKQAETSSDQENELFKALSSPVAAVSELALDWVEAYLQDQDNSSVDSFKNMFNLVLKAVGCKTLAEAHDLTSPDSAVATVNELVIHFEKQKYHENPFASTNKNVKHFQKNLIEFFGEVIFFAHEKGCLYRGRVEEDQSSLASDFMNSVIQWFTALSSSTPRPFRHVSTVILLNVVTQLCHQASSLEISLERQQRQLSNAKGNNKSKRNNQNQLQKIQWMTKNIETTRFRKETIEEYLDEISRSVFVHRYRDVDSAIRVSCINALGEWMVANPSYFLSSSYLRYFGWLLSDPTDAVREEVVKVLAKLYRFPKGSIENMAFSFRKFTKRFQQQLINMIWKENLTSIKINLFVIYIELLKIGFLQDQDKINLCSYIIYLAELESTHSTSNNRLKTESSRFLTLVIQHDADSLTEKLAGYTDSISSVFDNSKQAYFFRYKVLSDVLNKAFQQYDLKRSKLVLTTDGPSFWKLIDAIYGDMHLLPEWSSHWEIILQYLMLDVSAIPSEGFSVSDTEELSRSLELANSDQHNFIALLSGVVSSSLNRKARKGQKASSSDLPATLIPKLACKLHDLEDLSSKNVSMYPIFLKIWTTLLSFQPEPIQSVFEHSDNVEGYNQLHAKVLQFFLECETLSDDLNDLYKTYYSLLLTSSGNGHSNSDDDNNQLINPNIYLKIEDTILALSTEVVEAFNAKSSATDIFEAEFEQEDPFVCDQKDLCNTLIDVSNPLMKLSIIGDVISIIRFVGEPILDYKVSVLEQISVKLLSKLDFQLLVKLWPRNLYKVMKSVSKAWESLLDFILISLCWKLEDLMYALNDGTAETINVDIFLEDVCNLFINIIDCFKSLNEVTFGEGDLSGSESVTSSLKIELADFYYNFGIRVVDYLTSIKAFYDKTHASNRFRDYDAMFRDASKLGGYVMGDIPDTLENALMNVFYIKEAKLALLLGKDLTRTANENVNFEEFVLDAAQDGEIDDVSAQEIVTRFDSSDEEDDENEAQIAKAAAEKEAKELAKSKMQSAKHERDTWIQERDLSIVSMKLLGLWKAKVMSPSSLKRFALNGEKLGQTFKTIVSLVDAPDEPSEVIAVDATEANEIRTSEEQTTLVS
ncbi:uncharacterized protein CXQ87_000842 [Candidozyma duobushaemuli]|uniref:SCD domain-containing protein n=1 Tax=Candidozyma duobushaemuli TaxID=1231522 RepID=A0A2V1AJ23_9ASCO|nr:uncharacterized protein CXQ87_000842 [[Candida] duobushaemulonis]PVH17939.1 hypothetical protein CXQ87_000842 [[Candida] duobushaemulonis]